MATPVPDGTKPASRVKRFARWIKNDQMTDALYVVPYAERVLWHVAMEMLVLVMDGSIGNAGASP
jgi:hypothetical protein